MRLPALLILACCAAEPAWACDCIRFLKESPRFERDVDAVVDFAAVIADGVIVQPMGETLETEFRPTRVLHGPRRESYRIGIISDCGLLLREPEVRIGEPIRLILYGGPDVYEASRCVNLQSPDFDAAIARRLGRHCPGRAFNKRYRFGT